MKYGILRAACAVPQLAVADCSHNAEAIVSLVQQAHEKQIRLLVFPELSITGYTCGDLFLQHTLQQAAYAALRNICEQTRSCDVLFAAGLPVELHGARYNCAAFILRGEVLAVIPKTFIPEYAEFYERRWFTPAMGTLPETIRIPGFPGDIPFGTDIMLQDKNDMRFCVSAEICEDVWVPLSPSTLHALHGATVIVNLSASNEVAGKAEYRRMLVAAHSAKTVSAYLYASAGHDESSTDMVFGGHCIIAHNGSIAAESPLFAEDTRITAADLDLERLWHDRLRTTTFACCAQEAGGCSHFRTVDFEIADNVFSGGTSTAHIGFHAGNGTDLPGTERLIGGVDPRPFVPHDPARRSERCREVIEMQAEGLAKRLRHIAFGSIGMAVPFTYEQTGNDFVFHFGSAEDTTEAKFGWDIVSYPTLTFTKDGVSETITLNCLNNQNAETFDPFFYYDNDNNLYMHVNSFDEKSFTGDLYRQEMIKADYVDNAEEGSQIYSVNGTQFKVVSFEEVNADIAYGTDEEFKNDVVGTTRFDGFLVKCSTDDFYYALEKEDYEDTYKVVSMMTDENLRVLTKENVTFPIKENCEIILLKYISDTEESHFEEEYIIGREFKGDHYPGWSKSKPESYMTSGMLMSLGVIDGELYNAVQIYVP